MKLINRSQHDKVITAQLEVASRFGTRLKGLLGRKSSEFSGDAVLWIERCNSIHTWFMNFSIDVVFVDRNLKIKKIHANLKPWKMSGIVWNASSVFEMPAGAAQNKDLKIGDQLYVGP
jgi:uncharacterized membrane protein (UPF0127 family)